MAGPTFWSGARGEQQLAPHAARLALYALHVADEVNTYWSGLDEALAVSLREHVLRDNDCAAIDGVEKRCHAFGGIGPRPCV